MTEQERIERMAAELEHYHRALLEIAQSDTCDVLSLVRIAKQALGEVE